LLLNDEHNRVLYRLNSDSLQVVETITQPSESQTSRMVTVPEA
jgi:hypothetical protein